MKLRLALIFCFLLILGGCKERLKTGVTYITVNDTIYAAASNSIYEYHKGISSDSTRLYPKDFKTLPIQIIHFTNQDNIQVIFNEEPLNSPSYILYKDGAVEPYYRGGTFIPPTEKGYYYLCVECAWGTEEKYYGYQYYFYFSKE